jgi:hypothetical protein
MVAQRIHNTATLDRMLGPLLAAAVLGQVRKSHFMPVAAPSLWMVIPPATTAVAAHLCAWQDAQHSAASTVLCS